MKGIVPRKVQIGFAKEHGGEDQEGEEEHDEYGREGNKQAEQG